MYVGTAMMNEVLFGGRGESKLIVSVSIGFSALFRWKPRSSPDCEADSTWLHHGDLLVMDGRCQDEYLHSTDPRLDGGTGKYYLSVAQESCASVSSWCWGHVLLAHLCKGFYPSLYARDWMGWYGILGGSCCSCSGWGCCFWPSSPLWDFGMRRACISG